MAMQMYMVTFRGGFTAEASRDVQRHVRTLGGYILMVSPNGPVIAIDDSRAPEVAKHPSVDLVGGVTLNPRGRAAQYLQAIFTENLSKQIPTPTADEPPPEQPEGGGYVRRTRPT
jgi:hypothetical protein